MYKKSEIIETLKQNQDKIFDFGVSRLGIFGSYSRDEQTDSSDIDFMVEFKDGKKTFRNFMHLADLLENTFNIKIELITPESLALFMKEKILKGTEYVLSCC